MRMKHMSTLTVRLVGILLIWSPRGTGYYQCTPHGNYYQSDPYNTCVYNQCYKGVEHGPYRCGHGKSVPRRYKGYDEPCILSSYRCGNGGELDHYDNRWDTEVEDSPAVHTHRRPRYQGPDPLHPDDNKQQYPTQDDYGKFGDPHRSRYSLPHHYSQYESRHRLDRPPKRRRPHGYQRRRYHRRRWRRYGHSDVYDRPRPYRRPPSRHNHGFGNRYQGSKFMIFGPELSGYGSFGGNHGHGGYQGPKHYPRYPRYFKIKKISADFPVFPIVRPAPVVTTELAPVV